MSSPGVHRHFSTPKFDKEPKISPFFTQKEKPLQQAVAAPCRGNPSKKFNLIRLRQAFKDSQVGQDFYSGIADLGPVPQVFP